MTVTIEQLDRLPAAEAAFKFASCCGSSIWIAGMVERRPYGSREAMLNAAEDVFRSMRPGDWLDAFSHHPRFGETKADAEMVATDSISSGPSQDVRAQLAAANAEYERKFRFIFISATARSAEEILVALRERHSNERDAEIFIAAREQQKITRLRLNQLVGGAGARA